MAQTLSTILTLIMGSIIVVGSIMANSDDIVKEAKGVANSANVHQIATALEIYYLDHERYPAAVNGTDLVDILERDNYITNRPLDPEVFSYIAKDGGQNYSLTLTR